MQIVFIGVKRHTKCLIILLICIEFIYLYFPVLFCLSVSVKWLAVKTASEMTYIVSSDDGVWGVKLYSNQQTPRQAQIGGPTPIFRFSVAGTPNPYKS